MLEKGTKNCSELSLKLGLRMIVAVFYWCTAASSAQTGVLDKLIAV